MNERMVRMYSGSGAARPGAEPRCSRPALTGQPEGAGWDIGLIADADPDLDIADTELRYRERRWPMVASIALIVALSATLWLGLIAIGSYLAPHF